MLAIYLDNAQLKELEERCSGEEEQRGIVP